MDGRDQPQAIHSPGLPLDQAQGRTVISDNAVAKVVGVAARNLPVSFCHLYLSGHPGF